MADRFPMPRQPPRRSIAELIADGVIDAELAALAWLLIEARLPVVVAGLAQGVGKTTLLEALLDFLPAEIARIQLRGVDEDFAWLPEAGRLGWRSGHPTPAAHAAAPDRSYLVAAELSEHLPAYTWGAAARTLVRAASVGYGFGATIHADRLEDVHGQLRHPRVGLSEEELSYLGLVVVVRGWLLGGGTVRRRVVSAHYGRPVGRDEHGHTQRLPPAVLAARVESEDRLDHFEWGVLPEIGARLGRQSGALEADLAERAAILARLVASGTVGVDDVRSAIHARPRPVGTAPSGHRHAHGP